MAQVQAIISQGGKQYRVQENDRILVESLACKEGDQVEIKDVLMLTDGAKVTLGSPCVAGASVRARVTGEAKGPKVEAIVFKRRKRSRRRFGHRQGYTELLIEKIDSGSRASAASRSKTDTPKKEA
jgi:large subunit ribosomal protein L21